MIMMNTAKKKIIRRWQGLMVMAVALLAWSCSEFSDLIHSEDLDAPLTLTATADSTVGTALVTRAADGLYTATTGFDGTERVEVWMDSRTGGAAYSVGVPDGEKKSALTLVDGETGLYFPSSTAGTVTIYGVYPAASAASHTVAYDQTAAAGYKASDLMYARTTALWNTSAEKYALTPNLPFEHQLVKLKLTIVKSADVKRLTSVRMLGVKRMLSVTPATDVMTLGTPESATDGHGDEILINGAETASDAEETYTCCCVFPAQAWGSGNTAADFIAVTADGGTEATTGTAVYQLRRDDWMPGHEYTLTLSLNPYTLRLTSTITNWTDNGYDCVVNVTAAEGGTLTVASIDDQLYSGAPVIPDPKPAVTFGTTALAEGTDFDFRWYNNTNVGTAIVVAVGKGTYEGKIGVGSFNIISMSIADGSVEPIPDQTFNGVAHTPVLKVYNNKGVLLTPVADYTVTYTNNVNRGTATVTITGANNYTGTLETTFGILPRDISTNANFFAITLDPESRTYTGSEQTTTVSSVVDNGRADVAAYTMVSGTDYTVSGATSGTAVNTYTVTITGTGNYTGSKTADWKINKAQCLVTTHPAARSLVYNGAAQELVTAGVSDHGTMYYYVSTSPQRPDKSSITSTAIPTGTEQGTYYVTYYAKSPDDNYDDSPVLGPVAVTIQKRPVTLTAVDATIDGCDEDPYGTRYSGRTFGGLTASTYTNYVTANTGTDVGLVTGHYVSSIYLEPSTVAPGTGTLMPSSAVICDAGGNDVSPNYLVSYADGTLTVSDPGVALANSQVGYVVGSNGKAYDVTHLCMPQGVSIIGMVAYKSGSSGIVISARYVDAMTWDDARAYHVSAGSFYVSDLTATTEKTWGLPSKSQYNTQMWGAGGFGSYTGMSRYLTAAYCTGLAPLRGLWVSDGYTNPDGSYGGYSYVGGTWQAYYNDAELFWRSIFTF